MKRTLFLIACTALALTTYAFDRSEEEMKAIAAAKLNTAQMVKSLNTPATPVSIAKAMETSSYTIFEATSGEGFVIVSRDDNYPAVLGYSTGAFNADMPCCMKWWLKGIEQEMTQPNARRLAPTKRAGQYTPVAPFIKSKWGQYDPFNRKCPKVDGELPPVGCVATSLAQAINYYQYPKSAQFESIYSIKDSNHENEVKVNSKYSFPFLDGYGYYFLDGYTSREDYQYVNPGIKGTLVAQLCVDCAYATYMTFDNSGSSSATMYSATALTEKFGYPVESVKYANRSFLSDQDQEKWNNIIYSEMQKKCPILYGGTDAKDGGHAFILGGMDADGLVYVDWGWNGSDDGYYDITLMNPKTSGQSFKEHQSMVYGIRTEPLPTDLPEPRIYSVDGNPYTFRITNETDEAGQKHIAIHVHFTGGIVNYSTNTFDGMMGLFGTDVTEGRNWVIIDQDSLQLESLSGYFLKQPAELYYYYVEDRLKPGHTYRLSFGGRDFAEDQWHSILCYGGEIGYEIKYTGIPATTTISEVKDVLYDGIRDIPSTPLTAIDDGITRVYDASGRLVHTVPTDQFNLWDIRSHGILIIKQGEKVRKVVR